MKPLWQKPVAPLFDRPDINTEDVIRLGKEAERLLESDYFVHSVERVTFKLAAEWMATEDSDARERIWRTQKALAMVREELVVMKNEGIAAEAVQKGEQRLTAVQ